MSYRAPLPLIYPRPRYVSQRGAFWSAVAAAYGAGLVGLGIALDFPPLLLLAVSLATLFASAVAGWHCWRLHRSRKARRAINLAVGLMHKGGLIPNEPDTRPMFQRMNERK